MNADDRKRFAACLSIVTMTHEQQEASKYELGSTHARYFEELLREHALTVMDDLIGLAERLDAELRAGHSLTKEQHARVEELRGMKGLSQEAIDLLAMVVEQDAQLRTSGKVQNLLSEEKISTRRALTDALERVEQLDAMLLDENEAHQVTAARAEKAEADAQRLREALAAIVLWHMSEKWRGPIEEALETARAALEATP